MISLRTGSEVSTICVSRWNQDSIATTRIDVPSADAEVQTSSRQARQWLHLQSNRLWVLTDDRRREKRGHVVSALITERLIQLVAISKQNPEVSFIVCVRVSQHPQIVYHRISTAVITQ